MARLLCVCVCVLDCPNAEMFEMSSLNSWFVLTYARRTQLYGATIWNVLIRRLDFRMPLTVRALLKCLKGNQSYMPPASHTGQPDTSVTYKMQLY